MNEDIVLVYVLSAWFKVPIICAIFFSPVKLNHIRA